MTETQSRMGENLSQLHLDVFELLRKRKKVVVSLSGILLLLSLLIIAVGIYTTTRTENISITGYTSGIILAFGSLLGLLGLFLEENQKQLLIAAIIFLSFGVTASFLCVVVDGVYIAITIDLRPLHIGRCQHFSSGQTYISETYLGNVPCQSLTESCSLNVRSNTCYCCDLYDCANGDYLNNYFEFVGVKSCQDVHFLYILIWLVTTLNVAAFLLGIITTAFLGSFKNMKGSLIGHDVNMQLFNLQKSRCKFNEQKQSQAALSPTAPLLPQEEGMDNTQQRTSMQYMAIPVAASMPPCNYSKAAMDENPPPFTPLYNFLSEKLSGSQYDVLSLT